MEQISQPNKICAARASKRLDHIRMLRDRVALNVCRAIGEQIPPDTIDKKVVSKAEKKIEELKKSRPDEAGLLQARLNAIESYNNIIADNIINPQKDVEITSLPPEVVLALPKKKEIGLPLAETLSYSIDFASIAANLEKPDCGFGASNGFLGVFEDAGPVYAHVVGNYKKPSVPDKFVRRVF